MMTATLADARQGRIRILLVEDNPADVRLTQEVFKDGLMDCALDVAADGEQALAMLRQEGQYGDTARPDLILLDLNMPRKDGREVLSEVKADKDLRSIPIIVLTTSKAERDVATCYDLHANAYMVKPVDLDQFTEAVRGLQDYWLRRVMLPSRAS